MGKRSDFARIDRDFYPTPRAAALPLLRHLPVNTRFAEPCVGDGALVRHLEEAGHTCVMASDIKPQCAGAIQATVFSITSFSNADYVITNPPWSRDILHPMIQHFIACRIPAWLLFDADWPHTKQSSELMHYCSDIVPIGRVKWIDGSPHTGKDNAAWYRFAVGTQFTVFHTR